MANTALQWTYLMLLFEQGDLSEHWLLAVRESTLDPSIQPHTQDGWPRFLASSKRSEDAIDDPYCWQRLTALTYVKSTESLSVRRISIICPTMH